jgi:hypothetical protein
MKYFLMTLMFLSSALALTPAEYIQGATKIKNPFKLRDPFKPPRLKIKKKPVDLSTGGYRNGIYTNLASMKDLKIGNFDVVGIVVGKERRAIARLKGGKAGSATFLLKEGMKIGKDKAELKAILPGGVVFVEKISNVYGQDEYLETVIPISQE